MKSFSQSGCFHPLKTQMWQVGLPAARTPLSQGSHAGECYLRQFAPQVISGRVAVHVTQQIILQKHKRGRKWHHLTDNGWPHLPRVQSGSVLVGYRLGFRPATSSVPVVVKRFLHRGPLTRHNVGPNLNFAFRCFIPQSDQNSHILTLCCLLKINSPFCWGPSGRPSRTSEGFR